ncbi:MAG TPA: putative Na+/H+ antiporter, partial [Vicinamibacterales bacterium]|nr:putative Na+/H+ antiporter [Vicinamibacterales bacterium]
MSGDTTAITAIPRALESYPSGADQTLAADLAMRVQIEPFNAIATGVFFLAILHTFAAARFARLAHRVQHRHDEEARARGAPASPSLRAEALHFLGEVEVVFGLWAVVLVVATTAYAGWEAARHYVSETVNYTEPLFVVVIMALASTRPVIGFAESALRRVAAAGGGTPAAWWAAILTIGPVLGSFITEPAAMTICALLLARQFFDLQPSTRLK